MTPEGDVAPEHWLAHDFAAYVVEWARDRGAPQASLSVLQEAAYATSVATSSGHVCLLLGEVDWPAGIDRPAVRTRLLDTRVVGTPASPSNLPLILDSEDRLYLHRYFDYERRLAQRLKRLVDAPLRNVPVARVRARLETLFAGNAERLGDRPDWQKIAAALAMLRGLMIVSGGPGTGKTTTVVNLLACLLAQHADYRIALAAPTGKAAARMLDAIRAQSRALPPDTVARFPDESFTIHRLLGVTRSHGFRHHAGNQLPLDVLVVDEASMLDLALATRLFEAVPDGARVILLGDKDQLASVEAGAVFSEICADPTLSGPMCERLAELAEIPVEHIAPPAPIRPTPLHDNVVWFSENFRFAADSSIGRLAAGINAGDVERTLAWLRSDDHALVSWIDDGSRAPQATTLARAQRGYAAYRDAVKSGRADPGALFTAFGRFRVLCAERQGSRGVAGMNEALSRWFRESLDHRLDPGLLVPWYPGRPVMILRNDDVLRLHNGDIGIVLPDGDGDLAVHFPDADGSFRAIAPARLPGHDTAFATTVHKAQGSEFDEVMLMLPSTPSRVVTRELLYTGVTRTRATVALVGNAEVLTQGMLSCTRRYSGLIERMRDCMST